VHGADCEVTWLETADGDATYVFAAYTPPVSLPHATLRRHVVPVSMCEMPRHSMPLVYHVSARYGFKALQLSPQHSKTTRDERDYGAENLAPHHRRSVLPQELCHSVLLHTTCSDEPLVSELWSVCSGVGCW